jgi:AcrR family transcriptional regulator
VPTASIPSTPDRKVQIELEAARLFRDRGYPATSMRHLAQTIGMEAASLYNHFRSKEEILKAICFSIADEFLAAQEAAIEAHRDDPETALRACILAHIQVVIRNLDSAAVFFQDWRHLSEPSLSAFRGLRRTYQNRYRALIADGIRKNAFRPVDEKFAAMTLLSALNMIHEWYKPEGSKAIDDIGHEMGHILLYGLKTP